MAACSARVDPTSSRSCLCSCPCWANSVPCPFDGDARAFTGVTAAAVGNADESDESAEDEYDRNTVAEGGDANALVCKVEVDGNAAVLRDRVGVPVVAVKRLSKGGLVGVEEPDASRPKR